VLPAGRLPTHFYPDSSSAAAGYGFRLSVESVRWRGRMLEVDLCFERSGKLVLVPGRWMQYTSWFTCHYWDEKGIKLPPGNDDSAGFTHDLRFVQGVRSQQQHRFTIPPPDRARAFAVQWEDMIPCTAPSKLPARPLRWYLGG
jgi:hypothetical protein